MGRQATTGGGAIAFFAVAAVVVACGSSGDSGFGTGPDGGVGADGANGADGSGDALGFGDGASTGDGGNVMNCGAGSTDLAGCTCPTSGATRACYPNNADPKSQNVGVCKDGTQTCKAVGESGKWSACTGAVTPVAENCSGTTDLNCNGKVGCADPTCSKDPVCNTGCTNGQTRPCYDGPTGTENVGVCKDGTQTCTNGQWPTTCTGEVLPGPVNCCDAIDHACNNLPGCLNLFACILAPCCQTQCQMPLDPGCVCPQGSGDQETCPFGDYLIHKGLIPGTDECCPCTANDCGNVNCCGNDVCTGSQWCTGMTCQTLPPSCNGQVDADCDDFPEDCDEPCCLCSMCP